MTDRTQLLRDIFTSIDAMDTEAFLSSFSQEAEFRFGASPPVTGKEAIGRAVDGFFSTIAGVSHDVQKQISDGVMLACEGWVTYTRHDKSTVTLPFANILEFDDELIDGYRIYVEIAPLYAAVT